MPRLFLSAQAATTTAFLMLVAVVGCAPALRGQPVARDTLLSDEVARSSALAAHDAWFMGLLGSDVEGLGRLLDDEITLSYPTGTLGRKDGLLRALAEGTVTYDSADVRPAALRIFGHTAIFNGLSTLWYTSRGQPDREDLRYTAVYVYRPEGWRMVAWHSTRGGR